MKYILLLLSILSFAQTYQIINEENLDVSYRGLAFQDAKTFVVSGSKNTIGKTIDGGKTFTWINPKVVENRDFRDIEVLGKGNYLALGIDSPAYILQTKDGGHTWNKVYENNDRLEEFELKTYHVKDNTDLVIKGLGFINIKKSCDLNIYTLNHSIIEFRKSFLGSDFYE